VCEYKSRRIEVNSLNTIFILALAYVSVFLEAHVGFVRNLFGVQIDLLPAIVVFAALTSDMLTVVLLAIIGGLLFDSLSLNPLGVSILPLFLIGFVINRERELLLREHPFAQSIIGAVASILHPLMTLFLLMNAGMLPLLGWRSLWQLFALACAGAVATPLFFKLFSRAQYALSYQKRTDAPFRADREIKRGRSTLNS
jgi:rod shape-determining protein MreD